MTREEYETAIKKANCEANPWFPVLDIQTDYISSLETENAKLKDALEKVGEGELSDKLIQCPRCGDPITNELGDNPICGACALASELNAMTLQARIAELEKLLSGNPQTMTTQEMLAMPLNSEIALCNGCYIMRVPNGWIYKDTYNYSDGCGVISAAVFVPEPPEVK